MRDSNRIMTKAEQVADSHLLDYTARFHGSLPVAEYGGINKVIEFGKVAKEALDRGRKFSEEEIVARLGPLPKVEDAETIIA